jgi:hypothetical protein
MKLLKKSKTSVAVMCAKAAGIAIYVVAAFPES